MTINMSQENISPSARAAPYNTVDFKSLAKKHEEFRRTWQQSSGHLDFQDPATVKILSKAILETDFGLQIEVPDDRLCPPIPNRWNYVAWIQRLIDSTCPDYSNRYDPERTVRGLDIGTGASAIYTMLCLKSRPSWTMCATDIDKKSFDYAVRNLTVNNLVTRTKMLQTSHLNPLIPLQHLGVDRLDFTICNPPFFTDENDMQSSLKGEGKSWKPNAICTGAGVEMVCSGGDLGFVTRIVNESLVLRGRITWYSSMFGKLDSAKAIVSLLKQHSINNWAIGCIDTGGATKRWIVAWSFEDLRPPNDLARIEKIANEYLPFPTIYRVLHNSNLTAAGNIINDQLSSLDLHWTWKNSQRSISIGECTQNVWKRAYRREHERKKKTLASGGTQDTEMESTEDMKVALAFRISIDDREVVIDWLRGADQVLWESFCGMVHRLFKKG